ncbi:hypothetical protein Celaphus_00015659 [Cervus elaphus hippelaphus]|uniref:RNA transcription, translation and transport factor protein n=1 Tax=Cervus elaphus hippelaphus TaxID=46360 RepID=A0A212C202_CEREH|nr:hypothetical protein Celaphus_00015659 [Cervus elaphus hippelaphus]
MFRRKLTALDYHNPAGFNCKDETEFRNFIVWLEDQKIRHYKIEDREGEYFLFGQFHRKKKKKVNVHGVTF